MNKTFPFIYIFILSIAIVGIIETLMNYTQSIQTSVILILLVSASFISLFKIVDTFLNIYVSDLAHILVSKINDIIESVSCIERIERNIFKEGKNIPINTRRAKNESDNCSGY